MLLLYAFDNKQDLVGIFDAVKGVDYFCPVCNECLIFRKGKIKSPHFSHKSSSLCSGESYFHKVAKLLIQKSVKNYIFGLGDCLSFFRRCSISQRSKGLYCSWVKLPDSVDDAILEYRFSNGYVADIALMSKGRPIAAIEVFHTHRVDDEKASNLLVPFCEVDVFEVIENPLKLRCLRDTFKFFECDYCKEVKCIHDAEYEDLAFSNFLRCRRFNRSYFFSQDEIKRFSFRAGF